MTGFLRFVGILNAAIWLGAAFFLTVCAAPVIFSPEIRRLFGQAYTGLIAQTVVGSFFVLQYWCGGIALLHQIAEWVYSGRRLHRFTLSVILAMYAMGLVAGLGLQPNLKQWHRIKYSVEFYRQEMYTQPQKAAAEQQFRFWHAVSQVCNLATLAGTAFLLWRVTRPPEGPKFIGV